MNINIFSLDFCQPLVWVVLALVALIGIPNIFFYRELSCGYYPEEGKRLKIYNWVLSVAIVALWLVIIVANHTTVWHDVLNFVFVMGFSIVVAALACIAFVLVVSAVVFVILILYYLVVGVMAMFGKKFDSESEDDFE